MLDSEAELDLLQVLIFLWRERMPGSARESTIEPSIIQPLLTIIIASLLLALFRVDNLYLSHPTMPSQMFRRRVALNSDSIQEDADAIAAGLETRQRTILQLRDYARMADSLHMKSGQETMTSSSVMWG